MSAARVLPAAARRHAEACSLHHREARSRASIDLVGDAVYVVDTATLRIVEANSAAAKMFRRDADQMIGLRVDELCRDLDQAQLRAQYAELRASRADAVRVEMLVLRADGTVLPVEVVRRLIRIGEYEYLAVVARDISQRLAEQGRLSRSEAMMRDISEAIPDVFWTTEHPSGVVSYASAAYEKVFGRQPPLLLDPDNSWLDAVLPEDRERVRTTLLVMSERGIEWQDEYRVVRPAGDTRWVRHRLYPVRRQDGGIERIVNIATDITFQRESDQLMMQLVQYDSLTGLLNRSQFTERAELAIDLAGRNASTMGIVAIDLDRFINLKGGMGAAAGDQLLCEISRRLQAAIRPGDILARTGPDSFAVALTHLAAQEDAAQVTRKLLDACAVPIALNGKEVILTASAGIALFPLDGRHGEELLCHAIAASACASAAGCDSFQYHSADLAARSLQRLQLESDLRTAIADQQFELHFQPKYSLDEKRHCGFEALLRWRHPLRGMISPADFIPCLEESGMIDAVGAWVIEQTVRQLAAWYEQGVAAGPVAVNLAAAQLCKPGLARQVATLCAAQGVSPEQLEFEVTESTMMSSARAARDTLQALRDLGARVSIDDFGTGYSSLNYLKRLPVDTLKIDRSFVKDLESGGSDRAIVDAIIKLAHALSLDVVAEGVETAGQLRALANLGCDTIQGYLFSRPLPAEHCNQIAGRMDFLRSLDYLESDAKELAS